MFKIIAARLSKDAIGELETLPLSFVDGEKQNRLKQYIRPVDARRSLLGELLIRMEIIKLFGMENHEIKFGHNEYEKPFIPGIANYHFNVSHSGEWVVCAINNTQVGVDIEKVTPIDMEIASRFFAKEEYHRLLAQDTENQLAFFYDLWTAKESYIKAIGKGLSIPLHSFCIQLDSQEITIETEEKDDWYLKAYDIDPDYKLTVCAKTKAFPGGIEIKKEEEVYQEMVSLGRK